MYKSFLLTEDWDLQLNAGGDIALCQGAYAVAQNVANACRLFTHDAYYAPEKGIPHFNLDLGVVPNLSAFRAAMEREAETVEGVAQARLAEINITSDRQITGTINLTLEGGIKADVNF